MKQPAISESLKENSLAKPICNDKYGTNMEIRISFAVTTISYDDARLVKPTNPECKIMIWYIGYMEL